MDKQGKQDHHAQLQELIKDIRIAMFTTEDAYGGLHSRPMATQQAEFDGDLWFFTGANSGKSAEIRDHAKVNVCYAAPDDNKYVSVSGTAQLVKDAAKAKELWNPILKAWFPKGLDDPNLALIKVTVTSAEYWDTPNSSMVQIAGFLKAMATGKTYQPSEGEHGKLSYT